MLLSIHGLFRFLSRGVSNGAHSLLTVRNAFLNLSHFSESIWSGQSVFVMESFSNSSFLNSSGEIDNFICTFSPAIITSTTSILANNISDHQPYLINIHNLTTTQNPPTFIHINTQNYNSMNNFKMNIGNANILNKLNHQALINLNDNYEILNNIIKYNIKTQFPTRFVKYNKHKHKKSSWITNGIIRSITFRDNLYRKFKQISPDSNQFPVIEINLRT